MPLSPQQSAVVEFVRNGRGSAFVEAVAGAGKTTTLIEALRETEGSVAFTAYNKAIAKEIETKAGALNLGNRVRVGTVHSFGFSAWRRVAPKVQVDARKKTDAMITELKIPSDLQGFTPKLVSLAKQRGVGLFGEIADTRPWFDIIEHFDMAYDLEDPSLVGEGVEFAQKGLQWHIDRAHDIIDFDDMVYLPIVTGCRMWENDWVFVDEAQDTNPARRALCRKMLRKNGRSLWVGDRHQAIYGFTGADSDSVEQIIRDFNCTSLPLTITFRCPKAVVAAAQTVVSHIEAHESAPEGIVRNIEATSIASEGLTAFDAILCRKTAPLVELAYQLIRKSIPCHVEGKDIGVGLLKLVNRFSARDLDQLRGKLEIFEEREVAKLISKGKETQAEALQDRVATVMVLMENCQSVRDLTTKIGAMFLDGDKEAKPTLTLATVHKSKGREWTRVFILGRNCWMPSPWARQAWQLEQEDNLIYVAYTRAKHELVLAAVQG